MLKNLAATMKIAWFKISVTHTNSHTITQKYSVNIKIATLRQL